MLRVTKIFHFEMAHAIHGYAGPCKNIHGHSYELYVTVAAANDTDDYIPTPGFVIDFKDIKKLVNNSVIEYFDHKLVLSRDFLAENPSFATAKNLVTWDAEPTAENLLLFMKGALCTKFSDDIMLFQLKLYETKDSYAEWINDNNFIG